MEQNIIKGNKKIAEFMGGRYNEITFFFIKHPCFYIKESSFQHEEDLFYHVRWDWLMPVVEKIESLGWQFWIGKYATSITNEKDKTIVIERIAPKKITAVYLCIIEFINWYNTNK